MPTVTATCVEVNFPFGIQMAGSATTPSVANDPLRALMINLHGVLAAFAPIMKIVDFAKSIVDALLAIPSCITKLSPGPLLDKLNDVQKKLNALLSILPPASVPVMVRDTVSTLVLYLGGVRGMLASLRASVNLSAGLASQADALEAAGALDAANELRGIVGSALQDHASALASLAAQSCPYNHLAKTLGTFTALVHLPSIPAVPDFGMDGGSISTPQDLLDGLDAAIGAMDTGIKALGVIQNVVGVASFGGSAADVELG